MQDSFMSTIFTIKKELEGDTKITIIMIKKEL